MAESLFRYKDEVNHASSLHGTLSKRGGGHSISRRWEIIIRKEIWLDQPLGSTGKGSYQFDSVQ